MTNLHMTALAKAISDVDYYTDCMAFVSVSSDEYLDIHNQDGSFIATISPDEAESFISNHSA